MFSNKDCLRGKVLLLFLLWKLFGYYFLCPLILNFWHGQPQLLKLSPPKVPEFYLLFYPRGHVFNTVLNATLNQSEVANVTHLSFQAVYSCQRQRDRRVHRFSSFPRAVSKYSAQRVFWQDLQPMGDPPCWSILFLKNWTLWEEPTLEQFVKDCLLWVGPHAGAGEMCEEEGAAEMKGYQLTTTPIACRYIFSPLSRWGGDW